MVRLGWARLDAVSYGGEIGNSLAFLFHTHRPIRADGQSVGNATNASELHRAVNGANVQNDDGGVFSERLGEFGNVGGGATSD